ncbi:MAG: polyprenyl synthetase family protein [Proteobacteria bacterium]|uniref:polyprenyl synthetase family protein n=1 Tax=Ottowia sp. TaxID=1898956 RepID=UPI001DE8EC3A|nr:farnesyl diphosphate synthase [Ottowia sp.]MBS0404712.1 polyprenyl synthetase family protein [Pseudomonadota bacterium]MBS0413346.1 polyprenyl synthetase family protein [Pseudomonadota bacterium]
MPDMAVLDFSAWAQARRQGVEAALAGWVPPDAPAGLGAAMRYAVLDGGKRLRALLVLAASEAVHGNPDAALRAACAVELIHAYSLVHDDLPCMDDDVLRRGKPTVHVKFGEAQALLAGDALQALAFECLLPEGPAVPAAMQAALARLLARAAGAQGMAGGQAIDLASVGKPLTESQLRHMHQLKTGALLQASVVMGAACAPQALGGRTQAALHDYGAALGLAFQVVDDILDVTADSAALGKTAGKDAQADKPTYVSLLGLAPARALAERLRQQAQDALGASGLPDVAALRALADQVVQRTH